jgi:enoyl-CoA hydratase
MGYRCFEVDVADKVAHVRMVRPDEHNSMIRELWSELPALTRELDRGGDVRAMVLSSTGRHFSSGMDLSVFTGGGLGDAQGELGRVRASFRQLVLVLQETFSCFERARFPVLVAVQGGCIGAGVDLACAADLRYASEDAWFVIQEINIGLTADVGTLQRLPGLIPPGIARELALTGRRLPAARAAQLGLVNQVFTDHDALVAGTLEVAREIASKSPLAVWGTKQALYWSRDHSVADGLEHLATWQSGMFQPDDILESIAARAEKREPLYPDLLPVPEGL